MPAVTVRIKSRADLLGDPLVEFTDDHIEDLQINPSLYDLGENFIQLDRDFLFAPYGQVLRTGNLAEIIVHAISEDPLHSFFLEEVEAVLVGTPADDLGGRGSRWGGPGLLYYLQRARFLPWYGPITNGVTTWSDATPGAVMIDMLSADQNTGANGVNALADLTWDFSATLDSDGNAWDTFDGEFDVAVGTDYLTAFGNLQLFDDLDLVMTPDFVLHAYKSFGSTLSGADWATGVVRFQRGGPGIGGIITPGGNILTDQGAMKRRNKGKRRGSHILVQGRSDFAGDVDNYVLVERQGHDPDVDDVRVLYHEYPSNRTGVLTRVGRKILREGEVNNQNISEMEVMPGVDETGANNEIGVGLYLPGPAGTNGHYWLGDRPTTHTGVSFHDYSNATPRIIALRIKLAEATGDSSEEEKQRSLHTWVQFGVPGNRSVLALTDTTVPGPSRHTHPPNPELCRAGAFPDAGSPLLLGAACSQDGSNFDTDHAPWGSDREERVQITAAQPVPLGWTVVVKTSHNKNPAPSAANVVYDQRGNSYTKDAEHINTASSGDNTIQIWRCVLTTALQQDDYIRFAINVGSSLLPNLETGAKCIGAYAYPSTLGSPSVGTGAGTFSANPSITTPGGDVEVAGIAFWGNPPPNVTEDAGWQPMIPRVATGGGSGSITSALFGQQRFESSSGTWALTFSSVTNWAAISVGYVSTDPVTSLATPRDGRPELIGTSPRAARCDHKHHVIRTTTPTAFDDWQVRRYPVTTLWTQVDDLNDPTTIISTWLLVQSDAEGEAVWLQLSGTGSGTGSGMANPMTTAGDIIKGGTAGAPERLGIGSAGQVLKVVSGAPAWAAESGDGGGGTQAPWYIVPDVGALKIISQTIGATAARAFIIPVTIAPWMGSVEIIGLRIQVVTSSGNICVGIYDEGLSLLATSGSVSCPAAGDATVSFTSPVTLGASRCWFAFQASNTTASFWMANASGTNVMGAKRQDVGSLPLPDPFVPDSSDTRAPVMVGIITGGWAP